MIRSSRSLRYCLIALFSSVCFTGYGQRQKTSILKYETEVRDGKLVLTDGTELRGGIVFNDNEGIVTVVDGDDSQSFNARRIVKFDFFDDDHDRYRNFYALEFTDPETGITDPEIFEVLKELPTFVVLSKIDRIQTEARKGLIMPQTSPLLVDRTSRKLTQTQTVYFVNNDGDFEPYVRIVEKEIAGEVLDINETNTFYIDSKLFRKYTGSHYEALVKFAKQNDLSFKRRSDIITLLDEYEKLSGQ